MKHCLRDRLKWMKPLSGLHGNLSERVTQEPARHLPKAQLAKPALLWGARSCHLRGELRQLLAKTKSKTLQSFVADNTATVYTDDAAAYDDLPFNHKDAKHSIKLYVDSQVHDEVGIQSFRAMLKRCSQGHDPKGSPEVLA